MCVYECVQCLWTVKPRWVGARPLMLLDALSDELLPSSLGSGLWPRREVCRHSAV